MSSNIHWEKNIGRRLQLRDLQVFFSVVEQRSMAKAAAELGVTQPSISAAIAGLETSLGARLFERNPRGVELTPTGQALLARGRAAFDELRQGIRDIEFLNEHGVDEVRIGCPESIASGFLPSILDRLSQTHPRISVAVAQVNTPTVEFRELEERQLDLVLALLAVPDPHRVPAEYAVEILFEERLCIVVGRDSPLASRRKVNFQELSEQPWVLGPLNTPGVSWIAEMFRAQGVEFPKRRITTWSVHLRNHMAGTGRFVAITPESAFNRAEHRYALKKLPITLRAPRWPAAAVTLRKRKLSPVVNLFMDCARSVASEYRNRQGAR